MYNRKNKGKKLKKIQISSPPQSLGTCYRASWGTRASRVKCEVGGDGTRPRALLPRSPPWWSADLHQKVGDVGLVAEEDTAFYGKMLQHEYIRKKVFSNNFFNNQLKFPLYRVPGPLQAATLPLMAPLLWPCPLWDTALAVIFPTLGLWLSRDLFIVSPLNQGSKWTENITWSITRNINK